MSAARRVAFDVLLAVADGAFAADQLDSARVGLDPREAGLATELVFGVLRRKAQLDWLIDQVSSRKSPKLDPEVLTVLELGAYQLRFLDRIPAHAAVSESVELIRRVRKASASGIVNAVLRRLPPLPSRWPAAPVEFSLPQWLWDRWRRQFGDENARIIATAALHAPEPFIRVPAGTDPPEGAEATNQSCCYRFAGEPPPPSRRMDAGSQSIVPLLEIQPGQRFLDLCAAPGNKTAQAMEAPIFAVACDASPSRLRQMQAPGAQRVRLDASLPLPFGPVFDRILIDAPCSGTGTLARNPEIRWRLQPAQLKEFGARQKKMLQHALACLKPGGRLVYSTCSLEPEENELVVSEIAGSRVQHSITRLPGLTAGDGFVAAVIT